MAVSVPDTMKLITIILIGLILGFNNPSAAIAAENLDGPIETAGDDGIVVYGNTYFGDLDSNAPLILLFHQSGSNARGEYSQLARWLNEHGFRAIAWDARAGGDLYGATNRTQDALPTGAPDQYCDAYNDLQVALAYVINNKLAQRVVIWGSSYSGALVFRLAADNSETINGVFAFSPASGGPMVDCRARLWVDQVTAPIFVFRPTSEMGRETSIEQKEILADAGAEFFIIENGIHGSSMLVDERTEHDMSATRELVIAKLSELNSGSGR
jgi:pimeloyl-ACP methyl ester carboxylesterase